MLDILHQVSKGNTDALLEFLKQPFASMQHPADAQSVQPNDPSGGEDILNKYLKQPFSSLQEPTYYRPAQQTLSADPFFMLKPRTPSTTSQPMTPSPTPVMSQPTPAPSYQAPASSGSSDTGDDGLDHSSRLGFIRSVLPYAMTAEAQIGVPADLASLMIAINLNEQGWQHQAPGKNLFGIKGPGTGPVDTWEEVNGQRVNIKDSFRSYASVADSYRDFWNFLQVNPLYGPALQLLQQTHDPEAFIRAVNRAGYATDQTWAQKVITLMHEVQAIRRGG